MTQRDLLEKVIRSRDTWDTASAKTALRDAGVTATSERGSDMQARKALRKLQKAGVLLGTRGPGNTVTYRLVG
ncbi:hypothetical protein GA0115251_105916 [Streptomyces sp. TverLS-915]|uniref:hypothetical protein n=1 Tax=Streptomyces sp. TverLS-915 TaxID=1839763 RepID=UPI00081DD383|nr:hypothetical protein [Streptomyces sp. TverLS-915]SCD36993.1 hypothetical protein GA0115251_105916 [Streptomyces sp. TverLS-915]